jgi:hypothetical protein
VSKSLMCGLAGGGGGGGGVSMLVPIVYAVYAPPRPTQPTQFVFDDGSPRRPSSDNPLNEAPR